MTSEPLDAVLQAPPRRFRPYLEYKDSGVEWLGEIPTHWEVSRLKFVAPVSDQRAAVPEADLPYVALEHIESGTGKLLAPVGPEAAEIATSIFRPGDVLFGKLRPYLAKVLRANFAGTCSTELLVLRSNRNIDPSHLAYQMLSSGFIRWIDSMTYGTKMPRTNPDQIANSLVAIPPKGDQMAIVAFLDRETGKIDALVVKKERVLKLLQEKRTAVITQAVTKGLDPSVPMKDSGVDWMGEIPMHWEVRPLKRVSPVLTVGVVVNPSTYVSDEGVPFLYGSDIKEGRITPETARRIELQQSKALFKSQLHQGDLVMVRVGAPGVTAVVPPELEGANCASILIIRRSTSINSQWLCYALNSRAVRYQVEMVQYGAAQEQFNVSHAVEFRVPCPPPDEQTTIAAALDHQTAEIDALMAAICRGIDRLAEFRTALISAAVTGKIDVREESA